MPRSPQIVATVPDTMPSRDVIRSPWRQSDAIQSRPGGQRATCKACSRSFVSKDHLANHFCQPVVDAVNDPLRAPTPARAGQLKYKVLAAHIETAVQAGSIRSIDDLMEAELVADCNPALLMTALETLAGQGIVLPEHTPAKPVKPQCSEPDCDRDAKGRGLCLRHYKRQWRKGAFEREDPEHGTEAGYRRHMYVYQAAKGDRGEWSAPACEPCKVAHRVYNRAAAKQATV